MKKNKPINITFVLPTLQAGGAERVVSFVAQNIDKEKFNVALIVTGKKQEDSYELDNLKIIYLNKNKVRFAILSLVFHLAKNRSEIIFSSLSHLNKVISFISILFPNKTLVARETYIRPGTTDDKPFKPNTIHEYIEAYSFKLFDYIICQSHDMFQNTKNEFNLSEKKLRIISNPITDNFKLKNEIIKNNVSSYNFITVGRLSAEKGHLRLLEVLKKFDKPYTYTIIGDGPLKDEIFRKINTLGILDKINYIPFTKNVSDYLSKVDWFLQGSYTEGFPNALLESCAVGTPVIAFDVPGGTKEIIENGINGYLVNTKEEFLERLHDLPTLDPKTVSESVYKKFDKAIILEQYEQFFLEIVDNN